MTYVYVVVWNRAAGQFKTPRSSIINQNIPSEGLHQNENARRDAQDVMVCRMNEGQQILYTSTLDIYFTADIPENPSNTASTSVSYIDTSKSSYEGSNCLNPRRTGIPTASFYSGGHRHPAPRVFFLEQ